MRATVADDPERTCEERVAAFRAVLTSDVLERARRAIERTMGGAHVAVGGLSAADFLQEAIEATLDGRRVWRPGVEVWLHLRDAALDRWRWRRSMSARGMSLDPLLAAQDIDDAEVEADDVAPAPPARVESGLVVERDPGALLGALTASDVVASVVAAEPDLARVVAAICCDDSAGTDLALAQRLGVSVREARNARTRLIRLARRRVRRLAS